MATMVGGNLGEMTSLEQQFRTQSAAVSELRNRVTSTLSGTTWTGPAADRFRNEWNTTFSSALSRLGEALDENAAIVANRREAIQTATY